jgi:PIN domain
VVSERRLVLDANILMRAVLGRRVRQIIETHSEHAAFFAPDVAFADARRHLPDVVR